MRWLVDIRTTLDRRLLSDLLACLNYEVLEGNQTDLGFRSDELDNLGEATEVWEHAKVIRCLMTSDQELDPEFALGTIFDVSDPGNPKGKAFAEGAIQAGASVVTGQLIGITRAPAGLSEVDLLEIQEQQREAEYQDKLKAKSDRLLSARRSTDAQDVIRRLKKTEFDATNLGNIIEIIQDDMGGQIKEICSQKQLARCKQTLNHQDALGANARHARENTQPPSKPMSEEEIDSFVRDLAQGWFAYLATA